MRRVFKLFQSLHSSLLVPKNPSLFSWILPKNYSTFLTENSTNFSKSKSGTRFSGILNCERCGQLLQKRAVAGGRETAQDSNRKYALYVVTGVCLSLGVAYASAPLYKVFCQTAHIGGELDIRLRDEKADRLESIEPVREFGEITVQFQSSKNSRMLWEFAPQQENVKVYPGALMRWAILQIPSMGHRCPSAKVAIAIDGIEWGVSTGETALAFFTATNPTDRPIVGVSTYNVIPYDAAPYFNKIQCFCFEEQRLEPNETVDMPVFFYIDPEITRDHRCRGMKKIILGYTFFEAKGDFVLPQANDPGIAKTFEKQY